MEVKVVLLSGGSSGIGAATAHLLASAGMKVYAGSRRGTVDVPQEGIVPVKLDVNDAATVQVVVEDIVSREGQLDAVICNAGNGVYGPVEGTLEEEARAQFETTFFGSLKCIEACLPVFRRQGFGRIVTVDSVMGILPLPYQVFYSCAKAALLSLTEGLAMEVAGTGIECCCVLPGDVATGFTQARKLNAAAQAPDSPYKEKMARYGSARAWADDLYARLLADGTGGAYGLLGYSMGTIAMAEILKRILDDPEIPDPVHVFLAAHEPHTKAELAGYKPDELNEWVKERTIRFGGIPEKLLKNEPFWRMYLPLYRADYTLIGKYRFEDLQFRTRIPATVFYSETDTPRKDMEGWSRFFIGLCRGRRRIGLSRSPAG